MTTTCRQVNITFNKWGARSADASAKLTTYTKTYQVVRQERAGGRRNHVVCLQAWDEYVIDLLQSPILTGV